MEQIERKDRYASAGGAGLSTDTVIDHWGNPITTKSDRAVDALNRFTLAFAAHRAEAQSLLDEISCADPDLTLLFVVRGFSISFLMRNDHWQHARSMCTRAKHISSQRGATPREKGLIAALEAWLRRDVDAAIDMLESLVSCNPRDLLTFKLTHACNFILGRPQRMRASAERALKSWHPLIPGYGHALGCLAFALEETGDYETAEVVGRQAVEAEPGSAWAIHAVAHVFEMTDRQKVGTEWLESHRIAWSQCGNFAGHCTWHLALFHLELGEIEEALALYPSIRSHIHQDFRDFSNAASLLWRLEQEGYTLDAEWNELARLAKANAFDHGCAFADVHYALILLQAGRPEEALKALRSMRAYAEPRTHHFASVISKVACPIVEGLIDLDQGRIETGLEYLESIQGKTQPMGGSHAQRDLFEQLWIAGAVRWNQAQIAESALQSRLQRRPQNRWAIQKLQTLKDG
ncbi:MAG: tetratricopeptide repeat protein [Myxococcota bacterium]